MAVWERVPTRQLPLYGNSTYWVAAGLIKRGDELRSNQALAVWVERQLPGRPPFPTHLWVQQNHVGMTKALLCCCQTYMQHTHHLLRVCFCPAQ